MAALADGEAPLWPRSTVEPPEQPKLPNVSSPLLPTLPAVAETLPSNEAEALPASAKPPAAPSLLAPLDSAELLERARHYRRLADRADEQMRDELLYLAEQYEAMAQEQERAGQNSNDSFP